MGKRERFAPKNKKHIPRKTSFETCASRSFSYLFDWISLCDGNILSHQILFSKKELESKQIFVWPKTQISSYRLYPITLALCPQNAHWSKSWVRFAQSKFSVYKLKPFTHVWASTWMGFRWSKVQILSPRPLLRFAVRFRLTRKMLFPPFFPENVPKKYSSGFPLSGTRYRHLDILG